MLDLLLTRQSTPLLIEPAPSTEILAQAFAAAERAPDYGLLRPWRFLTIEGVAREKLGVVFVEAAKTMTAISLTQSQEKKYLSMPLRAPLVIVVIARLQQHPKTSRDEQLLAVGAATQNLLVALHALGFASIWRTGEMAYTATVLSALGLSQDEQIAGFIYVGTPEKTQRQKKLFQRPLNEFIDQWN